jgi:C4-dicarboxylate-specific signal transduction histidine kinase
VRSRLSAEQAARLEVTVSPQVTPVQLPRASFGQALLSLVKNALDATSDGPSPVVVEFTQDADRLSVFVRDQGTGIPPEVLHRAGEPFFTTKEAGRGLSHEFLPNALAVP